jgi:ABC-type polysaccharide/polyol phosphate transport system ATPase subunit
MSDELAVRASGLGKCYHIYDRPEDRLKQILWRGRRSFYREFWALRDVSFEVPRGATLGIIGRNGSGKSTLLQLLAGTLTPTTGSCTVNGRVAPLLELGTGFNPEFSGRENVFLNAAILGLSQAEIEARYADIARFADIGDFIDQPVKLYSSGMFVRLAFAVATAVDPDILILDEALSVGDARFQLACHERITRMLGRGMTLIFVSHDGNAVKRLCERALVLEGGRALFDGPPNDALNFYSRLLFDRDSPPPTLRPPAPDAARPEEGVASDFFHIGPETTAREYRYGSQKGHVESVVLVGERGEPATVFESGEHVVVRFAVRTVEPVARPIFALRIKNEKGVEVYGTNTLFQRLHVEALEPGEQVVVEFDQHMNLMPGSYFLSTSFVESIGDDIAPIDRRYDVLEFRVTPIDRSFGIANLHSRITIHRNPPAAPALAG